VIGVVLSLQKSDRHRSATGSSVVSSTLGHRQSRGGDLCHNGSDVASHRHREAAASQHYLTAELMIKHEEMSPQSGVTVFHASCILQFVDSVPPPLQQTTSELW